MNTEHIFLAQQTIFTPFLILASSFLFYFLFLGITLGLYFFLLGTSIVFYESRNVILTHRIPLVPGVVVRLFNPSS